MALEVHISGRGSLLAVRIKGAILCLLLGLTSPALAAPIAPLAEQTPKNFEAAVDAAKSAMMSQPAAALDEANRARALAEEFEGDERAMKIATARWLEGEALVRLNHPEQAEPVLREALEAAERIDPESKLHADLLKSGSSIAGLNGDVATAMRMLQEAHAIYLKLALTQLCFHQFKHFSLIPCGTSRQRDCNLIFSNFKTSKVLELFIFLPGISKFCEVLFFYLYQRVCLSSKP